MKLLMIIVDTECKEQLEVLLQHMGVDGYSEIPQAHGVGKTGVRMGSSAYPKTSSIFFTVLNEEQVERIRTEIHAYCNAGEAHMRMIVWGVEEIV